MEEGGFKTPPHGRVGDILESWWEEEKEWVKYVVAYTDEMAHCAVGKVVFNKGRITSNPHMGMPGGDRYWKERQFFCSAYVGCYPQIAFGNQPAVSWRRLQIGHKVFWIEYTSKVSWMSNMEGECEVIGVDTSPYFPAYRAPLFAVDFVLGKKDNYAVDLNFAPGIKGSGVENLLTPKEAVGEIEGWFREFGDGPTSCGGYVESQGA